MAFLLIQSGKDSGKKIELVQEGTTIGRSPDNAITLDDPSVSSRHCCILRDGNKYSLSDFDSTNGTYLNGEQIKDTRLAAKDIVKVGEIEMLLDGDDIEQPPEEPDTGPRTVVTHSGGKPTAFGARRNTNKIWVLVAILLAAALGFLLYWFISVVFK